MLSVPSFSGTSTKQSDRLVKFQDASSVIKHWSLGITDDR